MLYMIFNNKNSLEDFNLGIVESNNHYTVEEVIESISIDGRKNGSLTKKTGTFNDIKINRTFRLLNPKNRDIQTDKIAKWFNDIQDDRLWFSDYSQKCYIVKNARMVNIKDDRRNIVNIDVEFVCQPFLKNVSESFEEVSNNEMVFNYGDFNSDPIIKLSLPSNEQTIQITIKDKTLIVKNVKNELLIDNSMFTALSEGRFLDTTGNWLEFQKGENQISWVGQVNKFEIYKNIIYRG